MIRRFGYGTARGSTSRGGARALVQLRRELAWAPRRGVHGRRPARSGARGAAGRRLAGRRDRQPDPAVPHRGRSVLDAEELGRTQVPKPFSATAIAIGEPIDVRRHDRGRRRTGRRDWSSARAARRRRAAEMRARFQSRRVASDRTLRKLCTTPGNLETPVSHQNAADLFARFEEHARRPGTRSGRSGPTCSTAWRSGGAVGGRTVIEPAPGDARRAAAACTMRGYIDASRRIAGACREARRGHLHVAGVGGDRAAGGRRRPCRPPSTRLEQPRAGVRARAAAGAPRRARPRDGLLPLQQRRGRRGRRAPAGGARRHRRHRRPPRQRHAVDVLRRSVGALRVDAPVSVLSGHRRGGRDRHGTARLHRQRAARSRRHRRRLRPRLRASSCRCSISRPRS